eukprot:gene9300-19303_t
MKKFKVLARPARAKRLHARISRSQLYKFIAFICMLSNSRHSMSTAAITSEPTLSPTDTPSFQPTHSHVPTTNPSNAPSLLPTYEPTTNPSNTPSLLPTYEPTTNPSNAPSLLPTYVPTTNPSNAPSLLPTYEPTTNPSNTPSLLPTYVPTTNPSNAPSLQPTYVPTISDVPTRFPSNSPSLKPTTTPTVKPTTKPTVTPTNLPTTMPTTLPTIQPSSPTSIPSSSPSTSPSKSPTVTPTLAPSIQPSSPTVVPTSRPSTTPTNGPTSRPSTIPTSVPSTTPTITPTMYPSQPTTIPTTLPSSNPSVTPTAVPSMPTTRPTPLPSSTPTIKPTAAPSTTPTSRPTSPTVNPTVIPTKAPSKTPTIMPTTAYITEFKDTFDSANPKWTLLTVAFGPMSQLSSINTDPEENCNSNFICFQESEYYDYIRLSVGSSVLGGSNTVQPGDLRNGVTKRITIDLNYQTTGLKVTYKDSSTVLQATPGQMTNIIDGVPYGIVFAARSGFEKAKHVIDTFTATFKSVAPTGKPTRAPSGTPTIMPIQMKPTLTPTMSPSVLPTSTYLTAYTNGFDNSKDPKWTLSGVTKIVNSGLQLTPSTGGFGYAIFTQPIANMKTTSVSLSFDLTITCAGGCADGVTVAFGPMSQLSSINTDPEENCNANFICFQESEYSDFIRLAVGDNILYGGMVQPGDLRDGTTKRITIAFNYQTTGMKVTYKTSSTVLQATPGQMTNIIDGVPYGIVFAARSGFEKAKHVIDTLVITTAPL